MTAPEFSRPVRIDTLGEAARIVAIEADEAERRRLAARFGLVALDRLAAEAAVARSGDIVTASGRLTARLVQACVATGDPLPATVEADFALRFEPAEPAELGADEIEIRADELDIVTYEGGAVDLGEAVAETMALELDPFPRGPAADTALREAGVMAEGEEGGAAFSALKALRDRLGG